MPVVGCKHPPGKVSFFSEVLDPALTASSPLCRVVKEEISDDNAKLPCFNGRVVSWVSKPLASVSRCLCLLSLKTVVPSKARELLPTVEVLTANEAGELDYHAPVPQLEKGLCGAGSPVPGKMWDASMESSRSLMPGRGDGPSLSAA